MAYLPAGTLLWLAFSTLELGGAFQPHFIGLESLRHWAQAVLAREAV